ncbi:Similar to ZNF764: Zinc finger protein 764 (Homo sapiens) [Cotesia congregata]|uniref:Similar to ZNF764: Zinc finger protein 764 (Homo sapiens) n=1 Tax=Cotesia congregata TaxID=51543 RepID=A0A8J2HFJ3_COTCN|nr:Similar to ZNF764: Zinc finger protein 764 (Homo sapiens) [Cotesia congregata]
MYNKKISEEILIKKNPQNLEDKLEEEKFTCQFCEKKYEKYNSLVQHRSKYCLKNPKACRNTRIFQCPNCSYLTAFVSNMSRHIRTQHAVAGSAASWAQKDSSDRYSCPKCSRSYKNFGDMRKHLRFMCGQAPRFLCPYCNRCSNNSSNMYVHVRRAHKGRDVFLIDAYDSSRHTS